ncbi:DUF1150 family protein [Inquilinus sp. YAF38]|jgi:hypothetical protein|uniref:DUF1150 family protein n=1 Tax=Inquilinus TaxID=171673 RepID=UPI003D1D59D1
MNTDTIPTFTQMSPTDFAAIGLNQIAFVKPVVVEGEPAFAVHGADGTPLAMVKDRDLAFAVVRQNDMEPVSAH